MKFAATVFALVGAVAAQGATENIKAGTCPDFAMVVARGSTEPGNVGATVGPAMCGALKKAMGASFASQGVEYPATIQDNLLPKGTSDDAIKSATNTFAKVASDCPQAKMLFMGYSQGAAVMHATVPNLPAQMRDALMAGVLFGDTMNKQSAATIMGVPKENLASFCNKADGVCQGQLQVTAGHLAYTTNGDSDKAIKFVMQKMTAAKKRSFKLGPKMVVA